MIGDSELEQSTGESVSEMDSALADLGFGAADLDGLELQKGSQPSLSPEPTVRCSRATM